MYIVNSITCLQITKHCVLQEKGGKSITVWKREHKFPANTDFSKFKKRSLRKKGPYSNRFSVLFLKLWKWTRYKIIVLLWKVVHNFLVLGKEVNAITEELIRFVFYTLFISYECMVQWYFFRLSFTFHSCNCQGFHC